ncbi:vancomycin resistance protein VanW [Paenibacillus sp. V4I3]|uniref:VanW family protein n=1 Tax=unclassified Paenibacillus TaxID=185978 RepID=UPI00277D5B2F|nr:MULTISPECIES: VanW family protein [unclassified Paenibacillus]MDQ0877898.1 vancomycin resistance protein VanW [Paenibacillus sp. V4I3]MDQ0886278.1 vancomycin resistance protein VanW [Paenibacillus sp. V4I9]
MKQKLLSLFPVLYRLRIAQLRLKRHFLNLNPSITYAKHRVDHSFPYTCKKHQSLLRRKLGSSDPILQENKITNLRISVGRMDGIVIRPGETFSFWKLVGKTTSAKGYIEGLLLSQGGVKRGVGGGICQLGNLLFWMALHTPLQVVERHHHSFDPFPDDHRVLPFGSGASVFYNYIDLRIYNPTQHAFQFRLWLTDEHLKGSVHCDVLLPHAYHMEERNHRFLEKDGRKYRENEIWRKVIDKRTGKTAAEEQMIHNFSEVKYDLFNTS